VQPTAPEPVAIRHDGIRLLIRTFFVVGLTDNVEAIGMLNSSLLCSLRVLTVDRENASLDLRPRQPFILELAVLWIKFDKASRQPPEPRFTWLHLTSQ